jgi:hypothetical protein
LIELWLIEGSLQEERPRYAYRIYHQGSLVLKGSDMCGPASGRVPGAREMTITLADFLGATWECGRLTEHGESYAPSEQAWLENYAEEIGLWAYEMQNPE